MEVSKMSKKKTSIFNSKDETELFHSRDFWCEPDNIIEEINLSLAPHSELYYSKCCPIFSYEIANLESLNLFSSVLFRDGVVFLLDFFLRFPDPQDLRTKILVNEKYSCIIPKLWRDNISYFNYSSSLNSNSKNAIYIVNIDRELEETLEATREDLAKLRKLNIEDITLLPTMIKSNSKQGLINAPFNMASFAESLANEGIQFTSLDKVLGSDLSQSVFKVSDRLDLWCGDTFLRHQLCSHGAKELKDKTPNTYYESLELSLFHEILVTDEINNESISDDLWNFVLESNIKSNSLGKLNRIDGGFEDYINSDLVSLGKEVLRYIQNKKNFFGNEM